MYAHFASTFHLDQLSCAGEYAPQVGFGWTNGVAIDLALRYDFHSLEELEEGAASAHAAAAAVGGVHAASANSDSGHHHSAASSDHHQQRSGDEIEVDVVTLATPASLAGHAGIPGVTSPGQPTSDMDVEASMHMLQAAEAAAANVDSAAALLRQHLQGQLHGHDHHVAHVRHQSSAATLGAGDVDVGAGMGPPGWETM